MSSEKEKKCKEYCNGTVYVPLIDTENVEAMLYNMRAMAFCAGWDALDSQLAKRDEEIARWAFEGLQVKLRAFFGDIWNDMLMGKEAYYFIESEIKGYLNSEDFKKTTK